MSALLEGITDQEESKLALLLLRKRVIAESQLKAALDYQRSLGGRLEEVLVKLGLLRPSQLQDAVAEDSTPPEGQPQPAGQPARGAAGMALDPSTVNRSHLKVHRRLLDKIPRELIAQHLLVTFFPLPNGNTRKVILGHGRAIPRETVEKIRAMLGVDLCTLELDPKAVKELVSGATEAGKEGPPGPPEASPAAPTRTPRGEELLVALVKVLTRKGLVSREELERELGM